MTSNRKRGGSHFSSDDEHTGAEGFREIASRLTDLFGGLKSALDSAAERSGRSDIKPFEAQMRWRVRAGGIDLGAEDLEAAAPRRQAGAATPAARAMTIDVFDEIGFVLVMAELPGVKPEDVSLDVTSTAVQIHATGPRRFSGEAALPAGVDPNAKPEVHIANGMLEARLKKAAAAAKDAD